jgi:pimeloyl-ACP methyl ester carboxylesterase
VFDDFIKYNLRPTDDGLTLAYPREWEARVYASAPNVWPYMAKTSVPTHIIKAQYSDVITAETWQKIQEKTALGSFYEMPAVGHLVPMEKPDLLAQHILSVLAS